MTQQENTVYRLTELLDKRTAAADTAARKLQEATREANSTLGAIQVERKLLEAAKEALVASVHDRVELIIENAVAVELAKMSKATEAAMAESVAKVGAEFDKLEKIYLGESPDGKKSIREYTRDFENAFHIGYEKLFQLVSMAVAVGQGCTGVDCNGVVKYAVKMNIETPDGIGEMHTHLCHKHHRAMMDDPAVTVTAVFKMEDGVCPWKHPPTKAPMLYDEDDKKWYPAKQSFIIDKDAPSGLD